MEPALAVAGCIGLRAVLDDLRLRLALFDRIPALGPAWFGGSVAAA